MEVAKLAKKLEGLQTVSTIAKSLNINERTAINYVWNLRKNGYLTTRQGGSKVRIYSINSIIKKKRGYSFYELLNENSRVKLNSREDYIIHSKNKPSVEEILVRAVVLGKFSFRIILASLGLFNKIKDWSRLKVFADKYNVGKKIGALYDVARRTIKVRRMDERTRKGLRNKGQGGFIIKGLKSKHFKDIEKEWGVYIPFNKQDLEVYKE